MELLNSILIRVVTAFNLKPPGSLKFHQQESEFGLLTFVDSLDFTVVQF